MSTEILKFSAVIIYLLLLVMVGAFSYKKQNNAEDFIIGDRSLNYWLTALAAHASDMSSWLFMGYPAIIYLHGLPSAWVGIGLIFFMWLNWLFVAPKIRVATEQFKSLTYSSFFESRLLDTSGTIRIFTSLASIVFYTVYISAGLVTLGLLMNTLFGIEFTWGIITGILIVIPYLFIGGYTTLAWIDLFQGCFLLLVIVFVPLSIWQDVGCLSGIKSAASLSLNPPSFKLLDSYHPKDMLTAFFAFCSLGLGYFGQPHIVTKFMGIKHVLEIKKSMRIGMSWMVISLGAATLVGIVAIGFFKGTVLEDSEQIFLLMVNKSFPSIVVGFIFCAVLAATINALSSQVLVMASSLTEDLYKKVIRKNAGQKELLFISKLGVVLFGVVGCLIAINGNRSIYGLVSYAFSGIGASFGPLLLCCLYSKNVNKYGGWAGVVVGSVTAALWKKFFNTPFWQLVYPDYKDLDIPSLLPAFILGFLSILIVSFLTRKKEKLAFN